MTTELYNWRMSDTVAGLQRGAFPLIGLPPVTQYFPRDYTEKKEDAEGGTSREGFMTYELLWTRMDQAQNSAFFRMYKKVMDGDKLMKVTGLWYDTDNPNLRWVDLQGKPDVSDPTPNPPAFAYGVQVFSTIRLKLNNVSLIQDPAYYYLVKTPITIPVSTLILAGSAVTPTIGPQTITMNTLTLSGSAETASVV